MRKDSMTDCKVSKMRGLSIAVIEEWDVLAKEYGFTKSECENDRETLTWVNKRDTAFVDLYFQELFEKGLIEVVSGKYGCDIRREISLFTKDSNDNETYLLKILNELKESFIEWKNPC